MAMVVNGIIADLNLSCYAATTTTTTTFFTTTTNTPTISIDGDRGCNWNDWSPVVDWHTISGGHDDDFQNLVESMMDDNTGLHHPYRFNREGYNSVLSPEPMIVDDKRNDTEDCKGLRLVHLLMAAAEALTGVNKSRDLARVILFRLKELVSPSPNNGTNMERLAAYFTEALQGLLEGASNGVHGKHMFSSGPHHRDDHHQTDILAAFQLLQDMAPYVKFGHFTANQAILEAVAHDRRVHIVDYDIMEGIQWASLMQALVSRKDGALAPHLRITAISRGGPNRRSIGSVQETGRRLVAFAASIGQSFSFHQCKLNFDETFRPSTVKLIKGEALVINCMLNLPHFNYRAPDSVASFLSGSKTLNPRLVTLVEEEMRPMGDGGFMSRFMNYLHHYSAVYDSLQAGFPMQNHACALVERVFLGPRISRSLAQIYRGRGGDNEGCSWGQLLGATGFHQVNISFANHCQAKLLLGLFNDGYRVEELANNKLVLGWKSRRLLSASIWTLPEPDI
ncbi:unnamed protein product [Ilex paraguariensis]|uniref:Nodulation signaling pathway 2-like protein n=1 Tax=Ilex paraguariensis TaxID=185542 RepID=A0ABC8U992_9AQUA